METTLDPQDSGDINSGGTILPVVDGIVQSGGMPYDVAFYAISLSGFTDADAQALLSGTENIRLIADTTTGGGTVTIQFGGIGISAATEQALAGGTGSPGLFTELTANSYGTVQASGNLALGGFQSATLNSAVANAILAGDPYFLVSAFTEGGGSSLAVATVDMAVMCFAAGTRIATPRGEVAVEALREGDDILAGVAATPRPIRWIGERVVDLRSHPRPEEAAPICITAGAFEQGVPARDLLLSPEHCVHVDGRLIAARRLVNGTTVTQLMHLPRVHYYHVELAQHDLVRSEGLLTESYLDTGNRAAFANAGVALLLHPEFSLNAALRCWQTDACAPLADDAEARAVWERLSARSRAIGAGAPTTATTTTEENAAWLIVGGRRVAPVPDGDRLIFPLPRGAHGGIRLVSAAGVPAALRPWQNDRRRLGLCVRGLLLHGPDGTRRIALDDPALAEGWHAPDGGARWTDGNAAIGLPPGETPQLLEVLLQGRAPLAAPSPGPTHAVDPTAERSAPAMRPALASPANTGASSAA